MMKTTRYSRHRDGITELPSAVGNFSWRVENQIYEASFGHINVAIIHMKGGRYKVIINGKMLPNRPGSLWDAEVLVSVELLKTRNSINEIFRK